jgi:transcription initiation factor TFIIIB Brf1 subunit/transcription initiation factor TFIIB
MKPRFACPGCDSRKCSYVLATDSAVCEDCGLVGSLDEFAARAKKLDEDPQTAQLSPAVET